jgi:hypothetical protein
MCVLFIYQIGKEDDTDESTVVATAQAILVNKLQKAMEASRKSQQCEPPLADDEKSNNANPKDTSSVDVHSACLTPGKLQLDILHLHDNKIEKEQDQAIMETEAEYSEFLNSSNHIDAVDVLRLFLTEMLNVQSEVRTDLANVEVHVSGSPLDPLQVCFEIKIKFILHF